MTKPDIFLDFSIVPAQVSPLNPRNTFILPWNTFPCNTLIFALKAILRFFEASIEPLCDYTLIAGLDMMCPSSWQLNFDYFPFFSSSFAYLEPKLERFEDWSIFVRMSEQQILIKLQNTLTRVLDKQ